MIVKCKYCLKKFDKKESEVKRNPNHYCSKSCSAKMNNKIPKRRKKKCFCKYCLIEIPSRKTVCDKHNPNIVDWNKITKNDMIKKRSYQAYSRIRNAGRTIYKASSKPKYCINCGYDKHFDVCHIKAIENFNKDTPISVINDLNNLIALCKNCHWEQHNKLLDINKLVRLEGFEPPT